MSAARIARYTGEALASALSAATGTVFESEMSGVEEVEKPEEPIVWRQPFSFADGACLWLVVGRDLWGSLADAGAATDDEGRAQWSEIAGQAMAGIARAFSGVMGLDVRTEDGGIDSAEPEETLPHALIEIRNSFQIWRIRIFWSPELAAALPVDAPRPGEPVISEAGGSKTLELLLDVALPVSVSFGKTSLQIREVLKLNTGSVVELDRLVSEPVDVIVNNCVIARGEVVVVDGNYGVRVIHLASRADRLRSGINEASHRLGMAAK